MTATQASAGPVEVLLVEDSPADARLMKEALRESRVSIRISVVEDGVQALLYLRRQGQFEAARRPDVILLDLNLPKKDGRELLAEIKSDPSLRRIPVAVLTTSKAHEDIIKAYDLHANCYIQKPIDLEMFSRVLRSFEDFWLEVATLPTVPKAGAPPA